MATLIGVTVVNFQDCYRKTVASFVEVIFKKTKILIPLNDPFFWKIY